MSKMLNSKSESSNFFSKENITKSIKTIIEFIVIIAIALIIRFYVLEIYQIKGHSMESSFHDSEIVLVNKIGYNSKLFTPERGDVIVFKAPVILNKDKSIYVKRILGIPGDTIRIAKGKVYLKTENRQNFLELNESYLNSDNNGRTFLPLEESGVGQKEFVVPKGQYFVMGDNRNNSSDSRSCFGSCYLGDAKVFVPSQNIIGHLAVDFGSFDFSKFSWEYPFRGTVIPNSWSYSELSN